MSVQFREDVINNVRIEFEDDDPIEMIDAKLIAQKYPKYNEIMKCYDKNLYNIQFKAYDNNDIDEVREKYIACTKAISHLNISPKLVDFITICDSLILGEIEDGIKKYPPVSDISGIYAIVTEKYGISILSKYLDNNQQYSGPGISAKKILNNKSYFSRMFPETKIPKYISDQIKDILKQMYSCGWNHDDVHAGNFLIENNIVKIIDFDCISKVMS